MKSIAVHAAVFQREVHRYPVSHWSELARFVEGNERDPKNLFFLADDVWNAWPYAANGRPSEAKKYRFRFGHLSSFLKPYVKWYCYQRLIGKGRTLSTSVALLPTRLTLADQYILDHDFESLDDIASPVIFAALWVSQLDPHDSKEPRPRSTVWRQEGSRTFWLHLSKHFGAPLTVPPTAPHLKRSPTEYAADESKLIPTPVIRQLVNKLALHRDGSQCLNRFHHLRLCVLILNLVLGRRIDEVLSAPRGPGSLGPLNRYPARNGRPEGALWFEFCPNKHGPQNRAYISPEWEDIAHYCVRELVRYSDEVRDFAAPEESGLLILVSKWNWTAGKGGSQAIDMPPDDFTCKEAWSGSSRSNTEVKQRATALTYEALRLWLNDYPNPTKPDGINPGILRKWNITADGEASGEIYKLCTHQLRHTRQSALASDPNVPCLTRQRDLNHTNQDMQTAYQHQLREQNDQLLAKAKEGKLYGPGIEWLSDVLGTKSQYQPGTPSLLTLRWRNLIENSPQLRQLNRVRCGYCSLPQGPQACFEYMNCTEAEDGGCRWWVTDPNDEQMMVELAQRARQHRQQQQESMAAGRVVQANKSELLARRTERLRDKALEQATEDLQARLKSRLKEFEENKL